MTFLRTAGDGTDLHTAADGTDLDPERRDTVAGRASQPHPGSNGATHAQLIAQLLVLQERAATLPVIEQAKGALMLAYALTADEAFALLRSYSQNRNVRIRDIAARLTENLDSAPRSAAAGRNLDRLLDEVTTPIPRPESDPE
jgi:hypothetical protein